MSTVSSRWLATSFCYPHGQYRWRSISSASVTYLFECHSVLNQKGDSRVEISHILLEDEVFLGLAGYLGFKVTQGALRPGQVVADLEILFLCTHADIQRRHADPFALSHGPRAFVARHGVLSRDGFEGRGSRGGTASGGLQHCRDGHLRCVADLPLTLTF